MNEKHEYGVKTYTKYYDSYDDLGRPTCSDKTPGFSIKLTDDYFGTHVQIKGYPPEVLGDMIKTVISLMIWSGNDPGIWIELDKSDLDDGNPIDRITNIIRGVILLKPSLSFDAIMRIFDLSYMEIKSKLDKEA